MCGFIRDTPSKPDDAIRLLKTNLEFYPRSARSYAAIAFAYTRKLDDATAITYLEKSLEIEPNNALLLRWRNARVCYTPLAEPARRRKLSSI